MIPHSLGDLKHDPKNRRKHTDRNLGMLRDALRDVGASRSIVIDETGEILAGNGLVEAARAIGLDKVQVVDVAGDTVVAVRRSGLTPEQKRALAIYDNRTAELAEWDWEQLAADQAAGLPLESWFTPDEVAKATRGHPAAGLTDPDALPPPRSTGIKSGDMFALGDHRLLCGDATRPDDVARVLHGEAADLCLTDPPYGVGIEYDAFDDTAENVSQLAAAWLPVGRRAAAVVLVTPGIVGQWFYPRPDWVLNWFYGGGQLRVPWGFNCWQPVLAYGADPSLSQGRGCRPDAVNLNTPANEPDLSHPCPKPVPIWEWLIERTTFSHGATVLDVFAGAGTTAIAAERLRRRSRMIELSPQYCQVTIDRWEAFTGRRAEKVG